MKIRTYRVEDKKIDAIEVGLYHSETDECYFLTAYPLKEINGEMRILLGNGQKKVYKKDECSTYKKRQELIKKIKEKDCRDILDKLLKIYNIKYDELYI